jgi:hypothetical protein
MPRRQLSEKRADRLEEKYGLTTAQVVVAIVEERGLMAKTAARLGVTYQVLRDYITRREACAMALKEAREQMGDTAEKKLFEKIEQGDVRCIMYYLSTVHKSRGYGMSRGEADSAFASPNQIYVEQVNVIGVAPGTFLSPEEAKAPVIEEIATEAPSESPEPLAPRRRKAKGLPAPVDADVDADFLS